ncbi:MAG: transcriptional regulator [Promethearchaeota archaeon]
MVENEDVEEVAKTTREEIIELLTNLTEPASVDGIIKSMQNMREENILEDINHALKSLKTRGITFKIHPPVCKKCNFVFKSSKLEVKIPSKCPSCKGEIIQGPILQKK